MDGGRCELHDLFRVSPPPLVRNMNGTLYLCSIERVSLAPGKEMLFLIKTPSISKANAMVSSGRRTDVLLPQAVALRLVGRIGFRSMSMTSGGGNR